MYSMGNYVLHLKGTKRIKDCGVYTGGLVTGRVFCFEKLLYLNIATEGHAIKKDKQAH